MDARILLLFALLPPTLAAAGCDLDLGVEPDGDVYSGPGDNGECLECWPHLPDPQIIGVSPAETTLLGGTRVTLRAALADGDSAVAWYANAPWAWVVIESAAGDSAVVRSLDLGEAIIYVRTADGATGQAVIRTLPVQMTPPDTTIAVGATLTLRVTLMPGDTVARWSTAGRNLLALEHAAGDSMVVRAIQIGDEGVFVEGASGARGWAHVAVR